MDSRERLLTQTERLERTNTELSKTISEAQGSVQLGIEIMENLDDQRNTMHRIQDRVRGSNRWPTDSLQAIQYKCEHQEGQENDGEDCTSSNCKQGDHGCGCLGPAGFYRSHCLSCMV